MQRQTRQQRFTSAFPMWNVITNEGSNKVPCLCLECREETVFTAQTLNRLAKLGKSPECKSIVCAPPMPKGPWVHIDTDLVNGRLLIECEHCFTQYYHYKLDTDYLFCFCKLKTKKDEASIYKNLWDVGYTVLREAYFDKVKTSHKCDLLVISGDREVFIEVDGIEHRTTFKKDADSEFHRTFMENRGDNQFLVRINNTLAPNDVDVFTQTLENTVLPPVSRLVGTVDTETGPNPDFEEL